MLKAVAGGTGGSGSGGITISTTTITGGTNTRVLFDDNGVVGEDSGLSYVKGTKTLTLVGAGVAYSGAISAAAWTTTGLIRQHTAATLTDTSSSGTVAAAYTNAFGGNTIAASSATTYTRYAGANFTTPIAGTNVTMTSAIALAADNISVGGAPIGSNALAVTGTANISGNITTGAGGNVTQLTTNNNGGQAGLILTDSGGTSKVGILAGKIELGTSGSFGLRSSNPGQGSPTVLTSPADATWQLGATDVDTNAAIVAQNMRTQGALAGGTSNQAGKNFTLLVSPGKGTGVGGSFVLQTTPAGSTGTAVNAGATQLTVDGPGNFVLGNAAIATSATDGDLCIVTCAGAPSGTPTSFTGRVHLRYDTTNHQLWVYDGAWLQPKTPAGAATVTWQ